ncbi:MAG: LuxR family transcriptional regulator [Flaviaesturariibacter sp.]|nr:LuxR family transcriptional regulator [Flaviaesturariibacter sp.]
MIHEPHIMPLRVVIADDHEIFRDGFRVMLKKQKGIELVGEAANGEELLERTASLQPDVVITDIRMPVMDGVTATKLLQRRFPTIGVIALSMFDEENLIVDMMEAGAKGYLLKNAHKEEIVDAINSVHNGKIYFCKHTSKKLIGLFGESNYNPFKRKMDSELSEQELLIISLICREYSSKEIAVRLQLSPRTVESYRQELLNKIGARNVAGLVIYAIKNSIYRP